LAGQLNCTIDGNPGTAFGNVDDLTVTLGKPTKHHLRMKIALHAPLGSLLDFEKHGLGAFEYDPESNQIPMNRSAVRITCDSDYRANERIRLNCHP
jgi:hypothetical protein